MYNTKEITTAIALIYVAPDEMKMTTNAPDVS
jgi:hypothetical protein